MQRPQVEPLSAYLRRTRGFLEGRDWNVIADAVERLERVYDAAVSVVTVDELGHFSEGVTTTGAKALDELSKAVRP